MTVLIQTQCATTTLTNTYTNSNATPVIIDKFTVTNNDTVDRTFTVNFVPAGGVPDITNKILVIPVKAGQAYLCGELVGSDVGPNDAIWLMADTANVLVIRASGRVR